MIGTSGSSLRLGFVFAFALAVAGSPLQAQYFGQNKVQYRTFDFQVLKTEHFDIYFYPEEREGIDIAASTTDATAAALRTRG